MDRERWSQRVPSMAAQWVEGSLHALAELDGQAATAVRQKWSAVASAETASYSLQQVHELWQLITEQGSAEAIGLRLADQFIFGHIGACYYAMRSAATLNEALQQLNDNVTLLCRDWLAPVSCKDTVVFRIHSRQLLIWHAEHEIFMVQLFKRLFERMIGAPIKCLSVSLTQERPPSERVKALTEEWQCSLLTGQPSAGLTFADDFLQAPCVEADPHLLTLMTEQAQQQRLAQSVDLSLAARVMEQIAINLNSGRIGITNIADTMGLSVRSLQRGLEQEHSEYKQLVEQVRMQAAERYLAQANLTMNVIAARLGYTQPSSFNRWFKRLTGLSPERFRQQQKNCH